MTHRFCRHIDPSPNCETQPPASIGWVALSSMFVRSFVRCPAWVTPLLISTIWCFRPYKRYIFCEDMISVNISSVFITELSPVYCCLFFVLFPCLITVDPSLRLRLNVNLLCVGPCLPWKVGPCCGPCVRWRQCGPYVKWGRVKSNQLWAAIRSQPHLGVPDIANRIDKQSKSGTRFVQTTKIKRWKHVDTLGQKYYSWPILDE